MDGLGALGFWLFLGLIIAAGTVSEALKQRDRERERQATLRALLAPRDVRDMGGGSGLPLGTVKSHAPGGSDKLRRIYSKVNGHD